MTVKNSLKKKKKKKKKNLNKEVLSGTKGRQDDTELGSYRVLYISTLAVNNCLQSGILCGLSLKRIIPWVRFVFTKI